MSESNRSYRIRTKVGSDNNGSLNIDLNLLQDYDLFEILSLKIDTKNLYKYQTSKYGCVVGRVLANGGVGVPNVKISAFIPIDEVDSNNPVYKYLYPYTSTRDRDSNDIRYNLLTDQKIDSCHQNIGTFPNKRLVLDDSNILEVYDKYYIHTTTTNGSGDYMLFGVPVGNTIIHSDLDLSDIGFLSQKPRDLFYKGYNVNQFENANKFKKDTNLDNLTQVLSQDSSVYVFPFWGDETENEGQIKIVRNDIDVNYKFEPTCIFIGSVVSDERSNAISKRCIPHDRLGKMDRLTTGRGTIEMIRKTIDGDIESFSIQGNELIDGNGTWCYQIPMNLDYMTTDEYGNLVATDNYEKGIPTRTRVRFRVSLADYESEGENSHLVKVLVPNIPSMSKLVGSGGEINIETTDEKVDYVFGSDTQDESFRDLMWNNVYSVKSYIPRIQKGNKQKNKNFTGFKAVNVNNGNNPIPYNNMRINLTFLFTFQCLIFKCVVMIVKFLNKIIYLFDKFNCDVCSNNAMNGSSLVYVTMDGGICPNLNGNYVAPGAKYTSNNTLIVNTYDSIIGNDLEINDGDIPITGDSSGSIKPDDEKSSDKKNDGGDTNSMTYEDEEGDVKSREYFKIINDEKYFIKCVELQFALEYEVIQFDFYNDWLNGVIYIPRWFGEMKKLKNQMSYCGMDDDDDKKGKVRNYTQQCALGYDRDYKITSSLGCAGTGTTTQKCHKSQGRKQFDILKDKGKHGLIRAHKDSHGLRAYYLRPYEYTDKKLCNLFSTDIILLGNVNDCNRYGIPKVEGYTSSSYIMPPPTGMLVDDTQEMHGDMKKNFRTFLSQTINTTFKDAYNEYDVKIQMGEGGGGGTKTLDEIIYGKSKNGKEDAKYTLGLVFNSNVIFPAVSDLNQDLLLKVNTKEDIPKIKNDIIDNIMEVYRRNCYKHIFLEPKFRNGREDVIGTGIGEKGVCWVDGSGTSKENCNGRKFYETCVNYFDYPKHDEYPCNCSSANLGITIKDGLLHILTADHVCQPLCNERGIISGNQGCLKRVGKIEKTNDFLFNRIINSLSLKIAPNEYENFLTGSTTEAAKKILYDFSKSILNEGSYENGELLEISGIDWGYNPFTSDSKDNTKSIPNQVAGHFLEIGCMFSLSNIKSCVNLQRICEIGSEMSQSHVKSNDYFNDKTKIHPSGVITKKEISDRGIRSIFATLNSTGLETEYDEETGFFKYKFIPYQPVSFDGGLNLNGMNDNYKEFKSDSYIDFRFGLMGNNGFKDDRFLLKDSENNKYYYYLPQYRNSFYFYFGLKDGSTAIDRLYSEYYATCSD